LRGTYNRIKYVKNRVLMATVYVIKRGSDIIKKNLIRNISRLNYLNEFIFILVSYLSIQVVQEYAKTVNKRFMSYTYINFFKLKFTLN
jgi:hypothetical protein